MTFGVHRQKERYKKSHYQNMLKSEYQTLIVLLLLL